MTSTHRLGEEALLRQLTALCGPGFARRAGLADEVAGVPADWVAVPGTDRAAAEVLRLTAGAGLVVTGRGAGTKLDWGTPPQRLDVLVDTGRLAGITPIRPGTSTVEAGAGTPLRAVHAALERHGLRLAVDARSPGATIGGVLAAAESGPLRHRYGDPRRQLVGFRHLDRTGRASDVADPGAGAELARLFTGPPGEAGLLVSVTLRVWPKPADQLWVRRRVAHPREADELTLRVLGDSALTPAAIELDLPAMAAPGPTPARQPAAGAAPGGAALSGAAPSGVGELVVLLEGDQDEVSGQADRLGAVLGGAVSLGRTAPDWWWRYPFRPSDVALRVDAPVGHLHAVAYALADMFRRQVSVRGPVGSGVLYAGLPTTGLQIPIDQAIDTLRNILVPRQGRCAVLTAPPALRGLVDH